ncbi:MAG: hypothetical protein ACJ789_00765 [Thermomicrobiales bacterium]
MNLAVRSRQSVIAMLSLAAVLALVASVLVAPLRASAATTEVHVQNAGNQQNCGDELLFVLNGLTGDFQAPSTITVTYENSITQVLPLTQDNNNTVHYSTTTPAGTTIVDAVAVVTGTGSFSGNLVISHILCVNTPTNTPVPPTATAPVGGVTETPVATTTEVVSETATVPVEVETVVPGADTPTTAPVDESTTVPAEGSATVPVGGVAALPSTGAAPDQSGNSGMLAAVLLAVGLAGAGIALRRRALRARG